MASRILLGIFFVSLACSVGGLSASPEEEGSLTRRYLVRIRAGRGYLDRGRVSEALDELGAALALAPQAPHIQRVLVDHVLRDALIREARQRLDGGHLRAGHSRVLLAALEPDARERLEHRRELTRRHPGNVHYHIWHGVAALRVSLDGLAAERDALEIEALDAFLAARSVDPFEDRCYEGLIVWIPGRGNLLGRWPERIEPEVKGLGRAFHRLHCALGRQAPEDPSTSLDPVELAEGARVRARSLEAPFGDFLLGLIANYTGHHEEAARRLEGLESSSFLPAFTRARALVDSGDHDEAQEILESLARRYVEPGILHNLALCLEADGDLEGARSGYEAALGLNPDCVPTRYNLARLLHATDPGRAKSLVAVGLNRSGSDRKLEGMLGWMLSREGQFSQARPLLETGHGAQPFDPAIRSALARTFFHQGDVLQARRLLSDLIMREPFDETLITRYQLVLESLIGRAHHEARRGDTEEARRILEDLLHDSLIALPVQRKVTTALAHL